MLDAFAGGLLNPLTVPAHILALLGLGLLIGRQGAGWRLIALAAFALALAAGLAAIALALGQTPAVDVLLVATVVSGLMLALALALPNVVCAVIAVVIGAALGLELPAAGHPHGGRDAGIGRNLDRRVMCACSRYRVCKPAYARLAAYRRAYRGFVDRRQCDPRPGAALRARDAVCDVGS